MNLRGLLLTSAMRVLHPGLLPAYRACKAAETGTRADLTARQLENLRAQISFAYREIPFYQRLWDEAGCRPDIKSLEDFTRFPTIDKTMVQAALVAGEFGKERRPQRGWIKQSTTGSTGAPFTFYEDRAWWEWKMAKEYATYDWYGNTFGTHCAWFWRGRLRKPLVQRAKEWLMNRETWCVYDPEEPDASALSPKRLQMFAERLRREQPAVLDGFGSALAVLAAWMLDHDFTPGYTPRAVVCGGEMLDETDRALIGQAFGCTVFNRYGGTETGLIGHECLQQAQGEHFLHANTETLFVEALDAVGRPVAGQPGELVATHLHMRATPLIRYRVGDLLSLDPSRDCPCGRPQPLITAVQGRVNDLFVLPDGRLQTTHLWQNLIKQARVVRRFQMIQEQVDRVTVALVLDPSNPDPNALRLMKASVEAGLPGVTVEWREVSDLSAGPGGKYRYCFSRVPRERKQLP